MYAEKNCKAEAIIDVATLTGACMVALGTGMCAMFSPNQQLISQIKKAGSKSGGSLNHVGAHFTIIIMVTIINIGVVSKVLVVTRVSTSSPYDVT